MENSSLNPITRRKFIGGVTSATIGFSIIPSHVLGGSKHVAPSDKINLAYIGVGTQGLSEIGAMLHSPQIQITAVCDPNKNPGDYFDWGPTGLRDRIRNLIDNPDWRPGGKNEIPGGLKNGKEIVEMFYAKNNSTAKYKGCAAYTDFREMFAKEKNIDAVKIMTPDHLHGVIAAATIKRGIHSTMHKPVSNRLEEGYQVIEMAKKSDAITHLIPWDVNGSMDQIMAWINGGVIGELKEVHNWSNRPVWPQYAQVPEGKPVPEGFDWDLWLGPEAERRYHPHYTHMVFRGWYDFGGGAMADMGHYSLWSVFQALGLEKPYLVEPHLSSVCAHKEDGSSYKIKNDYSFPYASTVKFKYPAKGKRPAIDLIWYDGGMQPPKPEIFYNENKDFPIEGMMFVGDKGIIMSSAFTVREPYVLIGDMKLAKDLTVAKDEGEKPTGVERFVKGIQSGKQIAGNYTDAWHITEAVNLYAAALRSGKMLKYDANERKVTNHTEANKYLKREYRKGWDLESI